MVVFVRRDLIDVVHQVATTARIVVVEVGSCQVRGVYGKCGMGVHGMWEWLASMEGWIRGGDWVLLGDWNAHHQRGHWMGGQDLWAGC